MGKGDIKTKKGKITNGSYGVTRKRKDSATIVVKPKPKKEMVAKASVEEKTARPLGVKATPVKKAPAVVKPKPKKEMVAKVSVEEKPARPSDVKAVPAKKAPAVKKETTKKAPAKK